MCQKMLPLWLKIAQIIGLADIQSELADDTEYYSLLHEFRTDEKGESGVTWSEVGHRLIYQAFTGSEMIEVEICRDGTWISLHVTPTGQDTPYTVVWNPAGIFAVPSDWDGIKTTSRCHEIICSIAALPELNNIRNGRIRNGHVDSFQRYLESNRSNS